MSIIFIVTLVKAVNILGIYAIQYLAIGKDNVNKIVTRHEKTGLMYTKYTYLYNSMYLFTVQYLQNL